VPDLKRQVYRENALISAGFAESCAAQGFCEVCFVALRFQKGFSSRDASSAFLAEFREAFTTCTCKSV
jgi:hypothetical protein